MSSGAVVDYVATSSTAVTYSSTSIGKQGVAGSSSTTISYTSIANVNIIDYLANSATAIFIQSNSIGDIGVSGNIAETLSIASDIEAHYGGAVVGNSDNLLTITSVSSGSVVDYVVNSNNLLGIFSSGDVNIIDYIGYSTNGISIGSSGDLQEGISGDIAPSLFIFSSGDVSIIDYIGDSAVQELLISSAIQAAQGNSGNSDNILYLLSDIESDIGESGNSSNILSGLGSSGNGKTPENPRQRAIFFGIN